MCVAGIGIPNTLFHSILFNSVLFYSILFYSILFYSILFYLITWVAISFPCPPFSPSAVARYPFAVGLRESEHPDFFL